MRTHLVADVAAEWPGLVDPDQAGPVAMAEFVPSGTEDYAALVAHLGARLTDPWVRAEPPWRLLVTSEEDGPVHRAVGFWRRHAGLFDTPVEVAEASSARDGRLLRAAAARLPDAATFGTALLAPWRVRFRRAVLLPREAGQVPAVLDWAVQAPDTTGHRLVAHLLLRSGALGFCVLTESETERHAPSLSVYGPPDEVPALARALAS